MNNKYTILLICLLIVIATNSNVFSQSRFALVIGNCDYSQAPLKNPVNDAKDLSLALQNYGFDVDLKINATQEIMENAIYSFSQKLKNNSIGLFYFSGHGVQYDGSNYLIPIQSMSKILTPQHLRYKTVNAGYLFGAMEQAGNGLNIIILDACRTNPFKGFAKDINKGLKRMVGAEGTIIAYATSPGKIALDGKGDNSPYTKQLIYFMMNEPNLPIELLLKKVRRGVKLDTGGLQTPWYEASIEGNFFFRKESDLSSTTASQVSGKKNNVATSVRSRYLEPISDFRFSLSKQYFALSTTQNKTYLYDSNKSLKWKFEGTNSLTSERKLVPSVDFSYDSRLMAFSQSNSVIFYNIVEEKMVNTISLDHFFKENEKISALRFSRTNNYIAIGTTEHSVYIYDTSNWKKLAILKGDYEEVGDIDFSIDGDNIAFSCNYDDIIIYTTEDWKQEKIINLHTGFIFSIEFSPDGRFLASGDGGSKVFFFDTKEWVLMNHINNSPNQVYSISFSNNGQHIAFGDMDNSVKLYSAYGKASWRLSDIVTDFPANISNVSFRKDNYIAVTADNFLEFYQLEKDESKLVNK